MRSTIYFKGYSFVFESTSLYSCINIYTDLSPFPWRSSPIHVQICFCHSQLGRHADFPLGGGAFSWKVSLIFGPTIFEAIILKFELCAAVHYQWRWTLLFINNNYVFIWFSIIHHCFCERQI
jgi:hypothetical protein